MIKFFWFIWGLPQNIIGFILYLFYRKKGEVNKFWDSTVVELKGKTKLGGAVSLGLFIFVWSDYGIGDYHLKTLKHEYGHSIQSKILGPLYLLIIALPSLIWAGLFAKYRYKNKISYYSFYTEKWANKIMNIE